MHKKFVQDVVVVHASFLQIYIYIYIYIYSDLFNIYIMMTTSCARHLEYHFL